MANCKICLNRTISDCELCKCNWFFLYRKPKGGKSMYNKPTIISQEQIDEELKGFKKPVLHDYECVCGQSAFIDPNKIYTCPSCLKKVKFRTVTIWEDAE